MEQGPAGWVAALIGVAAFAALWVVLFHATAWLSGWRELARAYPPLGLSQAFAGPAAGERFRFRSAQLRYGTNYNNCLTFHVSPATLRLATPWLLFGHAPIEIPWAEVETRAERVFWVHMVTLRAARTPSVPIKLRRAFAERLASASGGQLALPAEGAR
jgi:hypothetical protein